MKTGRVVGLACLAAMTAPALSAAGVEVTWQTFDCPPMYILAGSMAGQGFMDRQLRVLIAHLPDLHHRIAEMTLARAWYDIEHQEGACLLGVRKTPERERVALFSRPISIARGSWLVLSSDRLAQAESLLGGGAVILDRLASRADLRGGYIGRRDYGEAVQTFLQDPARQVSMEVVPNESQLFRLLKARRIDFFFSYPSEVEYYRGEDGNVSMLPIDGDRDPVESYIACSDTPTGRAIIEQVNKAVADPEIYAALQSPRDDWSRSSSLQ